MLPPKNKLPAEQQRLLDLFRSLPPAARQSLLSYARFLVQEAVDAPPAEAPAEQRPMDIPRPAEESVIAAIRRLSETFPMLDKDDLLHETASLMTQHVMHGRPREQVIDELEDVFRRHFERVNSSQG